MSKGKQFETKTKLNDKRVGKKTFENYLPLKAKVRCLRAERVNFKRLLEDRFMETGKKKKSRRKFHTHVINKHVEVDFAMIFALSTRSIKETWEMNLHLQDISWNLRRLSDIFRSEKNENLFNTHGCNQFKQLSSVFRNDIYIFHREETEVIGNFTYAGASKVWLEVFFLAEDEKRFSWIYCPLVRNCKQNLGSSYQMSLVQ